MDKTYTEAEFNSAVDTAVEKAIAKWKEENETAQAMEAKDLMIKSLDKSKADLEEKVASAEAALADAEKKYSDLRDEITKGAKLQERMGLLSEANYAFSDSEEEQKIERDEVASMTEKGFEMMLNAAKAAKTTASENDDAESKGSKVDITVPSGSTFKTKSGDKRAFAFLKDLDDSLTVL
jgi:predicted nuclease with TOPRIM domain